jgi:Ser/Thr protein kinase RdoA (MazF antagonist)
MQALWKSAEPIAIHNDLHPCNAKVHRDVLSLYDFEDITGGFPGQDIGTAMYHVRLRNDYSELPGVFKEGHEEVLRRRLESDQDLDHFVIARLLRFANYVVNFNLSPAKYLPRFESKMKLFLGGKGA